MAPINHEVEEQNEIDLETIWAVIVSLVLVAYHICAAIKEFWAAVFDAVATLF